MAEIIHYPSSIIDRNRGVALLMVLMIVLAVTIIATGFIARADVELACGENMLLRAQMDHVANSALEHARGLLLSPQDASTPFWEGGEGLQLLDGSPDYYNVAVTRDASDPNDFCRYTLTCEAYRQRNGQEVGHCGLSAVLRLDPCIALWTRVDTTFRQNWVLHGDMRTEGSLTNQAATTALDGDVFATQLTGACVGQMHDFNDMSLGSLTWPPVDADYLTPPMYYSRTDLLSGTLSGNPGSERIWRRVGDLTLAGGSTVQGMLLVTDNLTIAGSGSSIMAAKNLPALYVGGDLVLEEADNLTVTGLAVVGGNLRVHAGAYNVKFTGGLCVRGTITETTPDASGNGHTGLLRGNPTWTGGALDGALQFHGVGDYVDAGVDPALDVDDQITVAAWVKTEDAANGEQNPFVTKGDYAYALKHFEGNCIEFFVYDASKPKQIGSGGWRSAQFPVDASFNGVWHHLAGTYDGSKVKLYIDGVMVNEVAYSGSIMLSPGTPLYIGANADWPDRGYEGAIDDVRIYHQALNETQIRDKVMAGNSVPSANLVAQWRLDGPGSRVTILADPVGAAIVAWPDGFNGMPVYWSPAAGAFFRSIERQLP